MENSLGSTHTGKLDATVTALGGSTLLLDVEVPELTTGGLDDTDLVGPRVVPVRKKSHQHLIRSNCMILYLARERSNISNRQTMNSSD